MNTNNYSNYERKLLFYLVLDIVLALAVILAGSLLFMRWYHEKNRPVLSELKAPDWYTQDFLTVNP